MGAPTTKAMTVSDIVVEKDLSNTYHVESKAVKTGETIAVGTIVEDESGMVLFDGTGTVVGIALQSCIAAVPSKIDVLVRGPAVVNVNNLGGKNGAYLAGLLTLGIKAL